MSMDIMLMKTADGAFRPATQDDIEAVSKLSVGKEYGVTLTQLRNGLFHRKLMALYGYLYDALPRKQAQYKGENIEQSFDGFRKAMTIMAGYHSMDVMNNGDLRLVADSVSYSNCSQEKAERIYSAVIDKALELLGNDQTRDGLDEIVNELLRFD